MSRMFQRTARAGAKALRPQCDLRDREEGGAEQARRPGMAGTMPHSAGGGGELAWCTLGAALGARDGRVLGCGWSLGRGEALPPRGQKQTPTRDPRSLTPAVPVDESGTAFDLLAGADVTRAPRGPFGPPCEWRRPGRSARYREAGGGLSDMQMRPRLSLAQALRCMLGQGHAAWRGMRGLVHVARLLSPPRFPEPSAPLSLLRPPSSPQPCARDGGQPIVPSGAPEVPLWETLQSCTAGVRRIF